MKIPQRFCTFDKQKTSYSFYNTFLSEFVSQLLVKVSTIYQKNPLRLLNYYFNSGKLLLAILPERCILPGRAKYKLI